MGWSFVQPEGDKLIEKCGAYNGFRSVFHDAE